MYIGCLCFIFFFFKQKTAYEMRISDWSSDVCSSDLNAETGLNPLGGFVEVGVGGPEGRQRDERTNVGIDGISHGLTPVLGSIELCPLLRTFGLKQIAVTTSISKLQCTVTLSRGDRKSVVQGRRVSVGLDLGGSGIITKNN